ncbi:MAG: helix-turn-helix domain-containing protein [Actinomycetota bacterium]
MLQISQRPLSGSDADQRLFSDRRDETQAALRAIDLGFNVLALGDPKSGRTSFLRHVERAAADGGRVTAFVDAQAYETMIDLVRALRAALGDDRRRPSRHEPGYRDPNLHPLLVREVPSPNERVVLESDIEAMVSPGGEATTIFIDNLPPAGSQTLFGRFRDVLWQSPHQWVASGLLARRGEYLEPPADAFFDAVIELAELNEADALDLLRRRVENAGDSRDAPALKRSTNKIVERTPERTPGALLAAARTTLLGGPAGNDAFEHQVARQQRAAVLGRAHSMLLAELESLAPVHAGDDRLLRRLGYTRPRIVQLLKDLEAEGVVESRREGRRTMYSPAAPTGGTDRGGERNKR